MEISSVALLSPACLLICHSQFRLIFKWHSPSGWAISTNQLSVCDKTISSPVIGWLSWVWLSRCQVSSPVIGQRSCVWLYSSTLNMCTESVQLKVGLINKSPMGVHALYGNSTVLPNIWSEQSVCKSLNKNALTHSNLLRFKNVSAACIMCTTECTVVQRGLKFKYTWSKQVFN